MREILDVVQICTPHYLYTEMIVAALDKDNEYIISSSDNMIDNPIAAASFLDKNHFYNKFTIC